MNTPGDIARRDHWDTVYHGIPDFHLQPDSDVAYGNLKRLLRADVFPGADALEIGCAPGKMLAWLKLELKAGIHGIDYSEPGIEQANRLFQHFDICGDVRCEDVFETTFAENFFDVVYSFGVIEHFTDPSPLVRQHVRLAKPGGKIIITVPNYSGIYGVLQRRFDPANLLIHNLSIMSCNALLKLAPDDLVNERQAFLFGRMHSRLINFHKKWPALLSNALGHLANGLGRIQPWNIAALCPLLVLRMTKKGQA